MTGRIASYLSPQEMFRLDLACQPIREAFDDIGYGPFLVGSVTQRRDFRDVDVRLILRDEAYDALVDVAGDRVRIFLGLAVSAYLRDATGLPVDFQLQRMTEANTLHPTTGRNALGLRSLVNFVGDATPGTPRPPAPPERPPVLPDPVVPSP